jgi:hypothetical protein
MRLKLGFDLALRMGLSGLLCADSSWFLSLPHKVWLGWGVT